jgi:heme exporter protein A
LNPVAGVAAVHASGLERRFGVVRVLCGLDLEVSRGESVVVFGSNGAGKTTLLRVLAGLCRPQRGSVEVLGTALPGDAALRRRIGLGGHDAFVYGDLSARENLAYYARLYRLGATARAEELLATVELTAAADRPARTYSRGMLQRLSLARALLHEPELLLLDEPFTGLDPHASSVLSAILGRLRSSEVTVVLTTHDFARGLAAADRALLLHDGVVAWDSGTVLPSLEEMEAVYAERVGSV